MSETARALFEQQGFFIAPKWLDEKAMAGLDSLCSPADAAGSRQLGQVDTVRALAQQILQPDVLPFLPETDSAFLLCTYFEKSAQNNWLVSLHQDLSVPVAQRHKEEDWRGWSEKEGMLFAQAPVSIMQRCWALRLHLDDCRREHGALHVVPGSHRFGRLGNAQARQLRAQLGEISCELKRAEALIMRPLLLHASSKATQVNNRRVLHFLFGPAQLLAH